MTSAGSSTRHIGGREIFAIILTTSFISMMLGYTTPRIALKLHDSGLASFWTGTAAAFPAMGVFLSSLLMPRLYRIFPAGRIWQMAAGGIFICLAASLLTPFTVSGCLIFFALGFACGLVMILGETWIAAHSPPNLRGRFIALYAAAVTGFQLTGPLLLSLFGTQSRVPVYLLLILFCAAAPLVLRISAALPQQTAPVAAGIKYNVFRAAPSLFATVFIFAFYDSTILSMLPIFAMQHGYGEKYAVFCVTLVFLGDALMQLPIGWLADKWGARKMHWLCSASAVLMLALLPASAGTAVFPAHLFAAGACAGGIYTLSLVRAGRAFHGTRLVLVNAWFGIVWGIGHSSGPVVSGSLLDILGADGIIFLLAALTAAGLLFFRADRRVMLHETAPAAKK